MQQASVKPHSFNDTQLKQPLLATQWILFAVLIPPAISNVAFIKNLQALSLSEIMIPSDPTQTHFDSLCITVEKQCHKKVLSSLFIESSDRNDLKRCKFSLIVEIIHTTPLHLPYLSTTNLYSKPFDLFFKFCKNKDSVLNCFWYYQMMKLLIYCHSHY